MIDVLLRKWFPITNPQNSMPVFGQGESLRATPITTEAYEDDEDTEDELEG